MGPSNSVYMGENNKKVTCELFIWYIYIFFTDSTDIWIIIEVSKRILKRLDQYSDIHQIYQVSGVWNMLTFLS